MSANDPLGLAASPSARSRSSISSRSSRCSIEGSAGKRFTPGRVRARSPVAGGDAARPLHGRRHGRQRRRRRRSTSRSTRRSLELLEPGAAPAARLRDQGQALSRAPRGRARGAASRRTRRHRVPTPCRRCTRSGSRAPRAWSSSARSGSTPRARRPRPARAERRDRARTGTTCRTRSPSIEPLGEEDVFDLTEPVTSHFVANGLLVHNCSEFVFLDDTACNLASINLMKFLRRGRLVRRRGLPPRQPRVLPGAGDPGRLRVAIRPRGSRERSHEYRPLGLGYANLGTLLMVQGLPYDSDAGARLRGVHHRDHDRRGLRAVGRDGGAARARSRATPRTATACST